MIRKIFKSTISIAILTLLVSVIIITGVLYKYFDNAQRSQIKSELQLLAEATEQLGNPNRFVYCHRIKARKV